MVTRRTVNRGLLWLGLACGIAGVLVYMVSLVVVVEYISATRGVSVGQGSMTAEWGYPTRFTYVPEAGALPLSTMIEQLPRPERWLIGPQNQGHVRSIQVPSPRWKEELNEMGDPVLHWRVLDQTLLQQSSGRINVEALPQHWIVRTDNGWVPAVQVPAPAEWEIARASAQRAWRWYPQLIEARGGAPGHLTIPAWLLLIPGLICAYLLLPPGAGPGTCQRCSFDLTRTPPLPDSRPGKARVRCPECGLVNALSARQAVRDREPAGAAASAASAAEARAELPRTAPPDRDSQRPRDNATA